MVLVHEVQFDDETSPKSPKRKGNDEKTSVRLTAGRHKVQTDRASRGQYQQPLCLFVEQGCASVNAELLDQSGNVIARLQIDIMASILCDPPPGPEQAFPMKIHSKKIRSATLILTMVATSEVDEEAGLVEQAVDTNWLVQHQLRKAKEEAGGESEGGYRSDMDVMKLACSGPLEMFEHLGKAFQVYLAILGPPASRRWVLGIWNSEAEFTEKKRAMKEVDLMRVQCVQADPTRPNVFILVYVNEHRVSSRLMFKRVDRARDVWVDLLRMVITKARDLRQDQRRTSSSHAKLDASKMEELCGYSGYKSM
jgi:hypothetical protein